MFGLDIEKLAAWGAAIVALILGVLGYGHSKRKQGKAEGKAEVTEKAREAVDEQVAERKEIEKTNANLPRDDLNAKLYKHARRDD